MGIEGFDVWGKSGDTLLQRLGGFSSEEAYLSRCFYGV